MKIAFLKTRYIAYLLLLIFTGTFLFNFLIGQQSAIMYKYFIEKPAAYNVERAERLSTSIYNSFKQEVRPPSLENIDKFIKKYNDIPFLSVNFLYTDQSGELKSIVSEIEQIDILNAEYVYPIKQGTRDIGTLLVYDINKEYKRGLKEYEHMLNITRIFFVILLFLITFILLYREYSTKIEQDKKIAEYKAVHDGLTGVYNQKYFKEYLAQEVIRSERHKRPLTLIMCDIDHFKGFNDNYGHLAGDTVLRSVSKIIAENVRVSDIVARYGGEEFAILLMEAAKPVKSQETEFDYRQLAEEALDIAKRIKDKIQNASVKLDDERSVAVTISMGLSSYNGEPDYDAQRLINEADFSLYESKNNGRNRVTVYDPVSKSFTEYV